MHAASSPSNLQGFLPDLHARSGVANPRLWSQFATMQLPQRKVVRQMFDYRPHVPTSFWNVRGQDAEQRVQLSVVVRAAGWSTLASTYEEDADAVTLGTFEAVTLGTFEAEIMEGGSLAIFLPCAPQLHETLPRKTKVVCTLGPACWDEAGLAALIDAGMNVARFNFSHGDHEGHAAVLQRLRKVRWQCGSRRCWMPCCHRLARTPDSITQLITPHHTLPLGTRPPGGRRQGRQCCLPAGHKGPRDPHRDAARRAGR
jgi:hypothetical protein